MPDPGDFHFDVEVNPTDPQPAGPQIGSTRPFGTINTTFTTSQIFSEPDVSTGPLLFDDALSFYIVPDNDYLAGYIDYLIFNRYAADGHIYMGGLTTPGTFQSASVSFVQLSAQTTLWVCDWTASRARRHPVAPSPTPADPTWVLLDVLPETAMIVVEQEGQSPIYRVSGTYVYGKLNPNPVPFGDVVFGRPPFLALQGTDSQGNPLQMVRVFDLINDFRTDLNMPL